MYQDNFRNNSSTLTDDGSRVWMYPKQVDGKYYKARTVVATVLLAFLFTAPFVKVNGYPLLLFNVLERKFVIFGTPFFPQDLYIFALITVAFVVSVILFTVIYGRVFCGWACPQTIFMEMVFRKIEYWIEGDANQQKKLNGQTWTTEKLWKKTLKHVIFFALSFLIANTFLSYLVGVERLQELITDTPLKHPVSFVALVVFTGAFYGVFAFFRELACIVVCPYGRLQSVLLDNDSMVVAYDFVRGEPRGKMKKNETTSTAKGDCVDCKLCVHVCPTGIDIRNGTQLECVGCTACIDVCDEVMQKINKPEGLIRYASINNIKEQKPFKVTLRIVAYTSVLVLLMGVVLGVLFTRKDVQVTVLRTPGKLYQKIDDNTYSNLYNMDLVNKTMLPMEVKLRLKNKQGKITLVGQNTATVPLKAQEVGKAIFFIELDRQMLEGVSTKVVLEAYTPDRTIAELETTFLGPSVKR